MSGFGLRALVVSVLLLPSLGSAPAESRERGADGHFDRRRSSHFVLLQDVDIDRRSGWHGSIRFEREVLSALEEAFSRLDDLLDLRPRRPITVVIYDPAIFDAQFRGLFRFAAAGFYHGIIRVRGDVRLTPGLLQVLHHELVHAALDQAAPSLVLPGWLHEGMAEWFSARALGKRSLDAHERVALHSAAAAGTLPPLSALSPPSFAHLAGDGAALAYLESYAFVDFLVRHHGEGSLRQLCTRLVRSHDLARSFRGVYRTDVSALEADFRQEIARGRR